MLAVPIFWPSRSRRRRSCTIVQHASPMDTTLTMWRNPDRLAGPAPESSMELPENGHRCALMATDRHASERKLVCFADKVIRLRRLRIGPELAPLAVDRKEHFQTMSYDVFGDFQDWGRVLDQVQKMRGDGALDEHQQHWSASPVTHSIGNSAGGSSGHCRTQTGVRRGDSGLGSNHDG